MKEIYFFVFLVAYSLVFALLEIQIEGKNGWASALPCWKIKNGWFVRYINGGRPLTGYHSCMTIFMLLMLHFPLIFVVWSWRLECLLVGSLFAVWEIEDFFWFVLNPEYGLKNFKPEKIPWHPNWWGPLPDFYWWFPIIWGTLFYFGLPILAR
jgi:hypothetical protein